MASIAEQMLASGLKSSAESGPDLAGNFTKGVQQGAALAQQVENIQMERAKFEEAKQRMEMEKVSKVASWYETGAKMDPGPARKAFMSEFIPQGISALKLTTPINPIVQKMLSSEPLLAARLISEIRERKMSMQALSDPAQVAVLAKNLKQYGDEQTFKDTVQEYLPQLQEAEKFALSEEGKTGRTQLAANSTTARAKEARDATGEVTLTKKIAEEYAEYQAAGGKATIETNYKRLNDAYKDLSSGKTQTGKGLTKWIGGSDFAVDIANPEVSKTRDEIRGAIVGTLRPILGGAFAEKEGQRILDLSFNPRLKSEENAKRVKAEIDRIKSMVSTKEKEFIKQGFLSQKDTTSFGGGKKSGFSKLSADAQEIVVSQLAAKKGISAAEARKELEGN